MSGREQNFTRPILILGSPRSGTSLTAGCFAHSGVWSGVCRQADEMNPKGYFEHVRLTEIRKQEGLALSLPRVNAILTVEGWTGQPWLYKQTPHDLRVWANFDPTVVLVWRDMDAILESRVRCGAYSETLDYAIAEINRNHAMMEGCYRRFNRVFDVYPENLIAGNFDAIADVLDIYGLTLNLPEINEFMDPALWQNRDSPKPT